MALLRSAFALCSVILATCSVHVYGNLDWESQRLNQFQQKYNNSRSDIIFLMDDSGSVSDPGFNIEKKFINSLLSQISVQPIATRVAVISFSNTVRKNIDYIDYNQQDKNKCTFTKEFARVNHRKGWATNMNDAFKRAQRLLDDAKKNGNKRSNVNTVIVLLTDGYWNWGGNPRYVANTLRTDNNYHSEILSVGVDGARTSQLQDIAGTSNNVIFASSFSDFEDLAARIRGDQIERLYQPVYKDLCGKVCDTQAICSCGTISGIYQCACGPGLYGSGDPGRCTPCPFGRYKTFASPDPCKLCPAFSSTNKVGSTRVSDCKCFEGYKGNPGLGVACKVVECPPFQSLPNGELKNCGNKYKETCTFACKDFHHIKGETSQSKKVACQKTGQWNVDRAPTCVATTCPKLPSPPHMKLTCDGNIVNSKCTFECYNGYRRNGTDSRTCRPDGQWSGEQPRCTVVQCPSLRRVDNVNITPMRCINSKTNYNDGCAYACKPGFTNTRGSSSRLCQADGTWSGEELVCEDKTPPTITCPPNVDTSTDADEATKEIEFAMPDVIDNSEALAQTKITVEQYPSSIKSPHKFPIGVTRIIFTARDEAGNQDSCTFRVEIKDQQKPVINCPPDIEKTSPSAGDKKVNVSWDIPTFKDNSGSATLQSTYTPPHSIPVNTVLPVKYTVTDASGNRAECTIRIKINSAQCPARDPPINGALPCTYIPKMGHFCTVKCMNPYEVNSPRAPYYICNTAKQWLAPYPYNPQWPDCTGKQLKEGLAQRIELYYYSGNCHENITSRNEIKTKFNSLLSRFLMMSGAGDCTRPDNAVICKSSNVKIACGKIQASKKRSTNQNVFTIEVDVEVLSKTLPDTDVTNIVNKLSTAVKGVKSYSSSEASSLRSMNVDGDTLTLNTVETVGLVTGVCNNGAVLGVDQKNKETIGKCVSCLAGKYFDAEQRECLDCPVGTYTDYPGRLGCTPCPTGKTTAKAGTHNKTECRAPCPPGSYSSTGIENCRLCGKGYYQPKYYGKQCLKCPGSTTTLIEGASKLQHCGMPCPAGTYSTTGVEPCLPCPRGYYQPAPRKTVCLSCSSPLFTHGEGSVAASQCTRINECSSNPCNNGGSCVDEVNGFSCNCKPGYLGKTCQQEKNECASNPCFGDAYCIDLVNSFECVCPTGFKGKFCGERAIECTAGKCQNGGKCSETPDGFACSCAAGFTGVLCERTINECESSPCMNNAICIDSANGFKCQCRQGFTGELCQENVDDCEKNDLCLNDGVCVDGDNDFTCTCKTGFAGPRCAVNIDECASNPCQNGAKCVDLVNGYKCHCAPTYYGSNCQSQRTDADFDLAFTRDVQSYSEASLHNDLSAFTIAFWVKGKSDDIESGTIVSYAADVGDSFVDNALVLQDLDSCLLTIMGKEIEIKVSVKDGFWHHVAVVWSSHSGSFASYQDGIKVSSGINFQAGKKIPSGGIVILGQEQDEVGRNFSMGEAFDGSISQLNVWNTVLAEREIVEMSRYRCPGILGNQLAWPDFLEKKIEAKQINDFCTVKNTKYSLWSSRSTPSNGNEHEPVACSNAKSIQCLSTSNKDIRGLNLLKTTCSPSAGFSCTQNVQSQRKPCPDFKVRFECPYTKGVRHCASSPCKNGAACLETSKAYRCICRSGYKGTNCDSEVACHPIRSFANGAVIKTGNQFGYLCSAGYRLSGSSSLTCRAGSLSGAVPSCVDVNECAVNNGGCNQKCVNTIGSFKCVCNKGFKLSGGSCVDENECLINNGNCQQSCINTHGSVRCRCGSGYSLADQKSCADVNECLTGNHNCEQLCINKLGSYSCGCRPGYVLGSDKISCVRRSCPSLSSLANGKVSAHNALYGAVATITCNSGYKLNGPTVRKCQRNGKWSGSDAFNCQRVACNPLGSIPNAVFTKTGDSYGSTYTYTCSQGYLMIGDRQRTCQQNGQWSGNMPRCVPYNCRPLTPPSNGRIVGTSLVTGSSVLVYCNKGFMLPRGSSSFRTCLSSGSWSNPQLSCTAVTCPAPQGIGNGTISSTGNTYGKKVTYNCNAGYGTSGPNVRVCEENGEWSGDAPTCVWQSCGYPGVPTNGAISGSDYTYGKKVTYSCAHGFRFIGDKERECLSSGRWTGSLPQCREINCGDPGTPSNGIKHGTSHTLGKSVSFDCNAGYSLSGSSSRKCGQDGNWDGTQPNCRSGVCGSSGLVGPTGSFTSRNYPNGYGLNEYCRWAISVKTTKKAALTVKNLKTERNVDRLEIRDGSDGQLISVLSGLLNQPITYTSASNKLDVKFVSDGKQVAAAEGFEASYHTASCGGIIRNLGETIQSPNYPSNYPNDITCVWQIIVNEPVELQFTRFDTMVVEDKLEVWGSLTTLDASTWIGEYSGDHGGLLKSRPNTGMVYVKFSTNSRYTRPGFKAIVKKSTSSISK